MINQSAKTFLQRQLALTQLNLRGFAVAANQSKQIHLLLFGAPGVGKGTYSKLIEKDFDMPTFSMGEYFRGLINNPSADQADPFLNQVRGILRSGKLVNDQTVIDVVKNIKLSKKFDQHQGMQFDGVPRTLNQAKMMSEFLKIDLVINFFNRDDILLEKLMSRRVCPSCSKNYNVANINRDGYHMKPLLPKKDVCKCDVCNVNLVIRDDDKESIIKDRMDVYRNQTQPILDFYKSISQETKVIDFEAKKGIDDYPEIKQILKDTLKI
ncbi:adenylate kinase [Stylonychia lemnae]|uniref:Adenylate kinase n=1 Tax=Stylonychia lemnae TaxID=5949 RepID=A0A077ZUE2_STYLE|nr:adenylate kinase [Stylonychia lemnae]|eukprot:CDW73523.1 adenylate kinase [Stylonychia lemnae]